MKITIFNGSPKGKNSNTNIITENFKKGIEQASGEVETIYLVEKKINYCIGCFKCWTELNGKCVFNDDMDDLITKFINSEIVVFATPLYVDNVSGIMKIFMDRLIPIVSPFFENDSSGETRHKKRYKKYPKIIVISNCGFPEISQFQVLKLLFKRIARNLHTEVIAEIFIPQGEILKIDTFGLKNIINKLKIALKSAGYEIIKYRKITEKTRKQLSKPILNKTLYSKFANMYWKKSMKNHG